MVAKTTLCGLEMPETEVLRLIDEPWRFRIGTWTRNDEQATLIQVDVDEAFLAFGPGRGDLEHLRRFNRIAHPEVDWLTYHNEHCDICRED